MTESIKNNIVFLHVNTHLDYKYLENRVRQIKVELRKITKKMNQFLRKD